MKSNLLKKLLVTLLFALPFQAMASYTCSVTVNKVLVYANGNVNIKHSGRGDYTVICNLKTPRTNVSITTCAMWTSMLQNIKKNDGKASFYYSGEGSCATLPTYSSSPTPVYIGDV